MLTFRGNYCAIISSTEKVRIKLAGLQMQALMWLNIIIKG